VQLLVVPGGGVLTDPDGGLHQLNPTGVLVWQLLDGRATLAEIAADVAAVAGAPVVDVLADLTQLADQLDAAGLLEPPGAPAAPGAPARAAVTGRRTLDEPGSCIPCGSKLAAMPWSGFLTLGVGDLAVGVRTHPDAATDLVAEVFGALVVDDAARDNFSVRLAEAEGPGARPGPARALHLCYRADRLIGRARRPEALLSTLAAHLASLAPPAGLVALDAAAVLDGCGRAVLLAPAPALEVAFARAIGAAGLHLGDGPPLWDPAAGQVLLGAPGLGVELAGLPADGVRARAEPVALLLGAGPGAETPAPAAALLTLAGGRVPPGAPEALAALVERLPVTTLDPGAPARARAARVAEVLGAGPGPP
jgi:hypothetical protein